MEEYIMMKEHYGVSHWPDEKAIFAKMDRLVNEPLHHIKPEAMRRYLDYFDTKCKGSKAMIDEAKKVIPGGVQPVSYTHLLRWDLPPGRLGRLQYIRHLRCRQHCSGSHLPT